MDSRLSALIDAWQIAVAEAYAAFLDAGLCATPSSRVAWTSNGLPKRGSLGGDGTYLKHGYGLRIVRNGLVVEFDFGPNGQVGPFDEYRLQLYWDENGRLGDFNTPEDIAAAFARAVDAGELRSVGDGQYALA